MALASPPRRSKAVIAASAHTSEYQCSTIAGAAAKQTRMMVEAIEDIRRGQGWERSKRNATQETRVMIVSSAGQQAEEREEVEETHANAGR
jgi:hypothetical protein